MPRTARKNKRESLLEEKRKLLDKLNAVNLQIKAANEEAKEKWDDAFLKGIVKIPQKVLGDEYYSSHPVENVLDCIREALGEMKRKEEENSAGEGSAEDDFLPDPEERASDAAFSDNDSTPAMAEAPATELPSPAGDENDHNEQAAEGNLSY